jgi:RNA polymerase sigma-70 factor (ECF subfamily)
VTADQETRAMALMIRAQQGDALAYADLLALLASVARRYVRGRVGDVAWADDVAQEMLLTIHGGRRAYDPRRPFAPWFYAILSRRFIDVLRRERRVGAREVATDALPDRPDGDTAADQAGVDVQAVHAALGALPARQREIVSALKLGDESVREVSARLGMSESAVKVAAHRGYRALRRMLGGGPS